MKTQLSFLLAILILGCGSESVVTGNTAVPITTPEIAEELPAPAAAAPVFGNFSFIVTGKSPLDSTSGGVADVAGFTPSAGQASRFVASFVDHPVGLLDRRLNVEIGRNNGPLLASGVVYPIGSGSLRVVYLERTSNVRAEIFEGSSGSLTLLESAPGTGKSGRVSFRLESVRLVSRSGQTADLNGSATLEF